MQSIGKNGEDQAVQFLVDNGYSVLKRNFRYKRSEIDIICKKDELLVFIEVKTRSSLSFGPPESFVSENQQASIVRGAEAYMEAEAWEGELRFDVISILKGDRGLEIEHFKDAFY